MATRAEWAARQREKFLALYADKFLSANELIPGLLDSYSAGSEAAELAADSPAVREAVRDFLMSFRPNPLPRVFMFGRITPEEAASLYRERQGKYAALLVALGLETP